MIQGGLGIRHHVILPTELLTAATRTSDILVNGIGADDIESVSEGVYLIVTLAAKVGSPTITPSIQMRLANGTTWVTLWTAAAALSADGTAIFLVYPKLGAAPPAAIISNAYFPLPSDWRVVLTYGGTGTFTSQAEVHYV